MTSDEGSEAGIDMSPLIDCVFILLIFFIVTTVFVEETGVEVDKPQAASASQLEKTSILIAVTDEGAVVYGGREIGVNGVQPLVKRMLQKEDIPVIIQADALRSPASWCASSAKPSSAAPPRSASRRAPGTVDRWKRREHAGAAAAFRCFSASRPPSPRSR